MQKLSLARKGIPTRGPGESRECEQGARLTTLLVVGRFNPELGAPELAARKSSSMRFRKKL